MQHIPLKDVLKTSPQRVTIGFLLNGLTPTRQIDRLRELFICQAENHQDKMALPTFQLVMAAVGDESLRRQPATGDFKERSEAECLAIISRAKEAQKLLAMIPSFIPGSDPIPVAKNDIRDHLDISPTLKDTRQAILKEILVGWKTAHNDKTADAFLATYLEAADAATQMWTKAWHKEERTVFGDILRKSIKESFGAFAGVSRIGPRLAHAVATFGSKVEDSRLLMMIVLATGWAKTTRWCDLWRMFAIIEPLTVEPEDRSFNEPTASDAVVEYLRDTAQNIQQLNRALVAALQDAFPWHDPKPTIEYTAPAIATIVLREKLGVTPIDADQMFDEKRKALQQALAPLRKSVPPYYVLRLRLVGFEPYTTPQKIVFQREDNL